jgi:hypothetical protein
MKWTPTGQRPHATNDTTWPAAFLTRGTLTT